MPATLLLILAITVGADQHPITVYLVPVETSAEGFVDEAFKRRQDSATDLTRALKGVTFAPTRDEADVVLEIVSSQYENTGATNTQTSPPLLGGTRSSRSRPDRDPTLTVTLTAGTYTSEIKGRGKIAWRQAADHAALQIQRWIRENHTRLIARRPVALE